MKKVFKYGGIYTLAFSLSLGVAFMLQYKGGTKPQNSPSIPETPGEKLISSLLNYEGIDLTADIDMVTKENVKVAIGIDGQAKLSDLSNISLDGNVDLNLDGTKISAKLGYFTDILTFSFNNNYFKLETNALLDFVKMIPDYGVSLEIPSPLKDLSLDSVEAEIEGIAEEDRKSSQDGYYYIINLGSDEEPFNFYVKTDTSNNFLGVRTDTIFYQDMKFSLDVTFNPISADKLSIVNPLSGEDAYKYEDFSPAFTLFDKLYTFIKKDSARVNVEANLNVTDDTEAVTSYGANLGIGYSKTSKVYTIDAAINEKERTHNFGFVYNNDTIYANFHSLKLSIGTQTISDLIGYAFNQIGDDKISEMLDTLMASMSDVKLSDIADKINNFVGHLSVGEETLTITLDPTAFDLEMQNITVVVAWDNDGLSSIKLSDVKYQKYSGDVTITFADFVAPSYTASEYVAIEPAAGLVESVLNLVKQKQFRFEFDGLIDKTDASLKDITIDGGLQFDIANNFGYGEANIVDGDSYNHNIKADMRSSEEIIFAYNDTLKGKFSSQTLKEMGELVADILKDPDAHMTELFGDLLNSLFNSPIALIMGGDYGLALDYDMITNLTLSSSALTCDFNLEILGLDKTISLEIDYQTDEENSVSTLKSVKISNLALDDSTISFNINLLDFDNTLDSSRLDPYDQYLDFSDIKVLLELGINTSKFNYYHFTSNVSLVLNGLLGSDLITYELPIDIKIRNDKGNVKVAVEFTNIPIKSLINPNDDYYSEKERSASVYYADDTVYVHRTEQVRTKAILGIGYGDFHTYSLSRTCDTSYFFDNILEILLGDILGMKSTYLNLIEKSTSNSESSQIHYEKLLNDFVYNKASSYFYFDINIAELAHDDSLTLLTAKVYSDSTTNQLTGLDVHMTISVGLKIQLDLSLNFEDDSAVELFTYDEEGNVTGDVAATVLSSLNTYVSAHSGDTRNEKSVSVN